MSVIKGRLSFANVISCVALFIALGGSAYAVSANSIGTKQLKNNAVTTKKVKKNAVTAQKIKKNAVTAAKLRNNAVTGAKISNGAVTAAKLGAGAVTRDKIAAGAVDGSKLDLATIGQVPSAKQADTLVGQETFFLKLNGGETKTIASHGAVSLEAKCVANDSGYDYITLLVKTTQDGAVFSADYGKYGGSDPSDFLNVNTSESDREWESESNTTDETYVDNEIDSGFVLGPDGKGLTPLMGCYGIGVTRIVAAAIEQNHDDKGIIWPDPIAPYTVLLVTLNHDRSEAVRRQADALYTTFNAAGVDVLYDDRDARPGVKFTDAELLGIPHCIVIGDRGLAAGRLEYRHRRSGETTEIAIDDLVPEILRRLGRKA